MAGLQHHAAAALGVAAAIVLTIPAEAKRGRDGEIEKLKSELKSELLIVRRELAKVRSTLDRPKIDAPKYLFLASALSFPADEAIRKLIVPPLASIPPPGASDIKGTLGTYREHIGRLPGVSLAGVPSDLVGWLDKVAGQCKGYKNISACRPGARVRGSGRLSLHASCRAVDFQVAEPSCAQKVMAKFPGGMSNDYYKVAHFHVSWAKGSGEWGSRFAHGGGRSYYAKRYKARHYRYARRWHRRADVDATEHSAASRLSRLAAVRALDVKPGEQRGIASRYGAGTGRPACGGSFDPNALTAAHRTLPCGTRVRVDNLGNGRFTVVTITDRGPFIPGRIIDVTPAGAKALGFSGLARVRVTRLG